MSKRIKPPGKGKSSQDRRWASVAPGAPVVLSQLEADSFAAEQYRNLSFQVEQRKRELGNGSLVVATSSSDPGAGKTLTALNLALTLARDGEQRVLLVEGDLWKPTLRSYLEIDESTPGLAQVLAGECATEDAVHTVWGTELDVLWAGDLGRTTGLMAQRRLTRFVEEMRSTYEVVIIDAPPVMLASGRALADCADTILVLVRSGQTKRRGIEEALSALTPDKVLGFVLNGARQTSEKGYAYYAGYARATEKAHGPAAPPQRWKRTAVAVATGVLALAVGYWLLRSDSGERQPEIAASTETTAMTALPAEQTSALEPSGSVADLLEGARTAARTVRSYHVGYVLLDFPGGDPGLERGNAADLVVRAFRRAGLDLQQEIHEDLLQSPEVYGALEPDRSIDHRRVRNLMTWLERHATTLDTDPSGDWQPGDVVFWATDAPGRINHVGVVSDRLADNGTRMVIHHFKTDPTGAEADMLTRWPIAGHFRWTARSGS